MSIKALAFGEIIIDIDTQGRQYPGGAPLNFAAGIARCSGKAYIYSAVGNDELAAKAEKAIQMLGVNSTLLQKGRHPTGTAIMKVDENAESSFEIAPPPTAWDSIGFSSKQKDLLQEHSFDLLYYGSLAMRSEGSFSSFKKVLKHTKARYKVFDVNLRGDYYSGRLIDMLLSAANLVKVNEDEIKLIAAMLGYENLSDEDVAQSVCSRYGLSALCLSRGKKGAAVFSKGRITERSAYPAEPGGDSGGCGDSFCAAFSYGFACGERPEDALDAALRQAAETASHKGALLIDI